VPTVRVEPSGVEFETLAGESVFAAATRLGFRWPTVCGGNGTCRACHLWVIEGAENLPPVESLEQEGLDFLRGVVPNKESVRLACQLKPVGNVVVKKHGVRPARVLSETEDSQESR
jgi:2Fe-2S ferredoxin